MTLYLYIDTPVACSAGRIYPLTLSKYGADL